MGPKVKEFLSRNALVIDVRTPEEYRGGHFKGSLNIPLSDFQNRVREIEKGRPIVVCCASGGRSSNAEMMLKQAGFNEVVNAGSWMNVRS